MVSADEAALLLHTSTRATWYWAEAGKLHCQETTEGLLRIQDKIMRERWLVKNNQNNQHAAETI